MCGGSSQALTTPDIFLIICDMKFDGFVSAAFVGLLFEYLEEQGHDAVALLDEPAPQPGDRGLVRYPMDEWSALLERASQALGEPALGLEVGKRITPAHIGVLGYVVLACANLGEALARLQRYIRLVYDHGPMTMRTEDDAIVLEWGDDCYHPGQLVDEVAITALVQFARNMTDQPLCGDYVSFVNAEPANVQPYSDYFGCPVYFNQPTTIVRFPLSTLGLPLRQPDATLLEILEQQADNLLRQLPQTEELQTRVRKVIARLCRDSDPTLDTVADQLNLSPRTLQRRLSAQGIRFQQLLDSTRLLLAEEYLRDSRLQLTEIAQLLGYSEQSAFNHAFRRWTGQTPRQFRHKRTVAVAGRNRR